MAMAANGIPANANQRSGMPAAKSTPATIAPRMSTVPRSWPSTTTPMLTAARGTR